MPMPATTFIVMAPPFGDCSDTTPSDVGQKKALPKLYTVAATTMATALVASDSSHRPTAATSCRQREQTQR